MKPDERHDLLRRLALIAFVVATAGSVTGWTYTVHELNALVGYQPVGLEARCAVEPEVAHDGFSATAAQCAIRQARARSQK